MPTSRWLPRFLPHRALLGVVTAAALAWPGRAQPAFEQPPRAAAVQALEAPIAPTAVAQPGRARLSGVRHWLATLVKPGLTLFLLCTDLEGAWGLATGDPAQAAEPAAGNPVQTVAPLSLGSRDKATEPVIWRLDPAVLHLGRPVRDLMDLVRLPLDVKGAAELPPDPGGLITTLDLDVHAVNSPAARGLLKFHDPDYGFTFSGRVLRARVYDQPLDDQEGVMLACEGAPLDLEGGHFRLDLHCHVRLEPLLELDCHKVDLLVDSDTVAMGTQASAFRGSFRVRRHELEQ